MQNINDLLQNQYQNLEEEDDFEQRNLEGEAPYGADIETKEPLLETASEELEEETAEEPVVEESVSETKSEEKSEVSASKFLVIKDIIENIKNDLSKIGELLGVSVSESELREVSRKLTATKSSRGKNETFQMKVVEGVFDGQNMIGGDGEHYTVPANYASKSKLVEGDLLKLTILQDGSFVYKQIAPIERRRAVGTLACDEAEDQYFVLAEGKRWKVLRASVTYFKGEAGDEVTIVIPKDTPSQWAAVENIIKR